MSSGMATCVIFYLMFRTMNRKSPPKGLPLKHVVAALEEIAPLHLAEAWDNVGLLLAPRRAATVSCILLTIDLTETVLAEAAQKKCPFIVSYHPILFEPVQRLQADHPSHRVVLEAVRAGITVYSPHTALDAVEGGVNDWLADGVGEGRRTPILPALHEDLSESAQGQGRLVLLKRATPARVVIARMKRHLSLPRMRLAFPAGHTSAKKVRRIGICAGAGASVLSQARADLFITGEMKHHDILAALAEDAIVAISEHTHTERGYLPKLKKKLSNQLGPSVRILVSKSDREPVRWG